MHAFVQRLRDVSARTALVAVAILVLVAAGIARGTSEPPAAGEPTSSSNSVSASTATQSPQASSAGPAAGTGSVDNEVVILNQTDGSFKHRSGFATTKIVGDTVANQNAAAAYSRCESCRTVAVAVQVVLVQQDASLVTPKNVAVALNYDCQACNTFAGAYQYVVSTGGAVHFTAEGEREMAAIENEIRATAGLDIPFPELESRLDALVEQLWATVDEEMVAIGAKFDAIPHAAIDTETSAPEVTSSPAPASTDATTGDAGTSAGTGDVAGEPTETPTETPTASPSATSTTVPSPTSDE